MRTPGIFAALLLCGSLLAGCAAGPTYEQPAAGAATATVVVGKVHEDNFVNSGAWLNVVAVDGAWTGRAVAVRVAPGEHSFKVRHFDGYALIAGNAKYRDITFVTEPGHVYEIRGSYCCGYFMGWLELYAIDRATQQTVARTP